MSFKDAFTQLVEDTDLGKDEIYKTLETINNKSDVFHYKPCAYNEDSAYLLSILCSVIVFFTKKRFNDSNTNYDPLPILGYEEKPHKYVKHDVTIEKAIAFLKNSKICERTDAQNTFKVLISSNCNTWEDVFYDLCHECLHLLNPTKDISKVDVQRLEEGVAVKFAEDMYRKYITPYCNITPINSPITSLDPTARHSQYYKAHSITSKISDDKLREVRSAFGSFWSIKDKDKFMSIVGDCITNEEADYLLSKFDYYSL